MINEIHPDHYNQGSIECIDAIREALTAEEFRGFCKGNIIKYVWRERDRGGNEDIVKASTYSSYILEASREERIKQDAYDRASLLFEKMLQDVEQFEKSNNELDSLINELLKEVNNDKQE